MIGSRGLTAVVILGLLLGGCANTYRGMRTVPSAQINTGPPANQAAIVFMRPSRAGGVTSTSLFELRGDSDHFIGILVIETRLVYLTQPGRSRFMVVGGDAEFMDANLDAGKTYYVSVVGGERLGDGRFVLRPLTGPGLQAKDMKECVESCVWVENTERSQAWARQHAGSVQKKKASSLPRWERKTDRPILNASDGQ